MKTLIIGFLILCAQFSTAQNIFRLKFYNSNKIVYTNLKSKRDTTVLINNLLIDTILLKSVIYRPGEFIRRCILLAGAAIMIDSGKHSNRYDLMPERKARRNKVGIWNENYFGPLKSAVLSSWSKKDTTLNIDTNISNNNTKARNKIGNSDITSPTVDTPKTSVIETKDTPKDAVIIADKRKADSVENVKKFKADSTKEANAYSFKNLFSFNASYWENNWPIASVTFGLLSLIVPTTLFFLYQYIAPPKLISILIAGAPDVGKSTLAFCLGDPDAPKNLIREEKYNEGIFVKVFEKRPVRYRARRYIPRVIDLPWDFDQRFGSFKAIIEEQPIHIVLLVAAINPDNDSEEIDEEYIDLQSDLLKGYLNIVPKIHLKLIILYINKFELFFDEHPDEAKTEIADLKNIFYNHIRYCSNRASKNDLNIEYRTYFGSAWNKWFTKDLFESLLFDLFKRF